MFRKNVTEHANGRVNKNIMNTQVTGLVVGADVVVVVGIVVVLVK